MAHPITAVLTTATLGALLVSVASWRADAAPRTVENADLKYSVSIPSECRVEEGPGTLEAICAPDFDEAKSVELPAATALLLEVDGERVPADAKPYGEAEFRREAPEAVCGDGESQKVKLTNFKETRESDARVFTASVVCPDVKFLALAERTADVRYVIAPGFRYRLMARALSSDRPAVKAASDSFLQSFRSSAEKKS